MITEEKQDQIGRDLLWDYTQTNMKLVSFRVEFRSIADGYARLAQMLRENPEDVEPNSDALRAELEKLTLMLGDFKTLLYENAERYEALSKLGVVI